MRRHRITVIALGAALAVTALAGGALLAAGTTLFSQASGPTASPNPSGTPTNPKVEAAKRNTPPPPRASPPRWSARSAADVAANLPADANFAAAIARLSSAPDPDPRAVGHTVTLGAPLFVRGLAPGDADEYLVPVNVGATTIAIIKVGVDAQGFGSLDAVRGWSAAPSFPAASQAEALARAGAPGDPAVKAELVWTYIRAVAEPLVPFWRLTRVSGAVYFLFEDGTLVSAKDAGF